MTNIKLQSSDGEIFDVEIDVAKASTIIKDMLEQGFCSVDDPDEPIPLPNVKAAIMKLWIEWARYHKDDPPPIVEHDIESKEKRTDDICSWDAEFMRMDQSALAELIVAANYLDIKDLFLLGCKTVANMIKGKTVVEIRKHFNVENDFTPEEEAKVRKEYKFCEEK